MSTASQVARIVKQSGFDVWFWYNDRNKRSRRLKFMRNGYEYTKAEYRKWDHKIKRDLAKANITVLTAGFETCDRPGYSEYKAYIVRITEQPK